MLEVFRDLSMQFLTTSIPYLNTMGKLQSFKRKTCYSNTF